MNKNKYKILVVEDNPGDFVIIEDFLTEILFNTKVIHAVDFKQANKIIAENETPLDIILLDLSLPDKAGNALITEILKIAPKYYTEIFYKGASTNGIWGTKMLVFPMYYVI